MKRSTKGWQMKVHGGLLSTAAAVLVLVGAPGGAHAQVGEASLGYGGGYMQFAPFVEAGAGLERDIRMAPGWVATIHAEHWMGSQRVGLRASAIYTDRPLELPASEEGHGVYGLNADLLLRLLPAAPGRTVSPFISAGGGILGFDLGSGGAVPVGQTGVTYVEDDRVQWAVVGGFGIDIYPGWELLDNELGIRLEGVDHYIFSGPFRRAGEGDPAGTHNWRVTIGLVSLVVNVL